jgi:hypothetical protein
MAITVTDAKIRSISFEISGGIAQDIAVDVIGTDSAGGLFTRVFRVPLTSAQQTNFGNFANGLISEIQTATNLTLTLA